MKINMTENTVLLTGRDKAVYEYMTRDYNNLAKDYVALAKREKTQRWEAAEMAHRIQRYENFETALDAWKDRETGQWLMT